MVGVPVPFKGKFKRNGLEQIGGSLFEQGLFLMMEAVVLILMRRLKKSPHELWKRHTKLE